MYTIVLFCFILVSPLCAYPEKNISCYQCLRHNDEPCNPQDLKQCSSKHDRCVVHISKTFKNGYSIKRECGLAPCSFDDDMVNKGLGMGICDKSKNEYFCWSCCREDACNKSPPQNSYQIYKITGVYLFILIIKDLFQIIY